MTMISSLLKDKMKNNFLEKASQIVIKVIREEKSRSCGLINLNLSDYINQSAGIDQK